MLRTSLKAAWAHKRRLLSTTVAVVLGVAFMAGTLVLSDTLDRSFDEMFGSILAETDAEVRGRVLVDGGFITIREPIDTSLIEVIAAVDGVEAVGPYVEIQGARLLDADGDPIGSDNGPPTLLQSWIDDPALAGVELTDGRAPERPGELALNLRAARDAGFDLGDEITLLTAEGQQQVTLVGTYRIGDRDSALGAVTANVVLEQAQELSGTPERVTSISARSDEGTTQDELVRRIEAALPQGSTAEVLTGEEMADEISDNVSTGLSFFTYLLLVFAFIALVVGAFIIYNTFAILVAQRGRELALLRTLGASRRQVFASVLVEAAIIGLVAALIGLGVGVLLAIGIQALLGAIGLDLPPGDVVISSGSIVAALITGLVVTVASAFVPAWRATRVAPLAALREVGSDRSGTSIVRVVVGVLLLAGVGLLVLPAFGDDPDTDALISVGGAALALLLALVTLGPVLARPLAKVLGSPLPRVRGTTGQIARENAARSPKRTATSAAALMIGVGLIVFINIFTSSVQASIDAELRRGLRADYIVAGAGWGVGIPLGFADEVRALDGVSATSSVQGGLVGVRLPDDEIITAFVTAIEPADHDQAITPQMAAGSLTDLEPGGIIVDRRAAANRDLGIGDQVEIILETGDVMAVTLAALGDDPELLGSNWVITQSDWADNTPNVADDTIFVVVEDDADPDELRRDLDQVAESYPAIQVQDQDEFLGGIADSINTVLNVVYGLLALSLLIALIGIANTLSLSIHERTRELGLLRAVGMTRSQVRSAVRWEAAIISLIGTALGLVFGLACSYALITALEPEGLTQYRIPTTALAVVVLVFGLLGVLASVLPARRAAKLDVLEAIATE